MLATCNMLLSKRFWWYKNVKRNKTKNKNLHYGWILEPLTDI